MNPPSSGGSRRRVAFAGAALVAGLEGIRRLAGTPGRVTIEGASMEPALAPGDRLLFFPPLGLRRGDIVVVADPRDPARLLVKRIRSVDRLNHLVSVEGDNLDHSTDSRAFGPVARRAVLGRAVYRYAPAGRTGPVGRGR